jgi:hypothetical protein
MPFSSLPRPENAVALFDGKDLLQFQGKDGPAKWEIIDNQMIVNKTGNISTKQSFGDCHLHLEWRTPKVVSGEGQGRGNSGVFLMGRYEIQVLDSFENPTYADGQAGAIYGQFPPLVNVCRPPGEWQTYDIFFRAPRCEDGVVTDLARVTVIHNGTIVQNNQKFFGPTRHKSLPVAQVHDAQAPLVLQDHGDPVAYRNIWIVPLSEI